MSLYTAKTGISSILKSYSASDREKAKISVINKVHFALPKERGLISAIDDVMNYQNYLQYNEFISFLSESTIIDSDLLRIISEARKSVLQLKPIPFSSLVETILSINWIKYDNQVIQEYMEFVIELLVAHNKYSNFVIRKLIALWNPKDLEASEWINAEPSEKVVEKLKIVHYLLERILNVIPMTFDILRENLEDLFPYYKKPSHVVCGFIHNVLWLLEYKPDYMEFAMNMIFKRLLLLDVNAPRNEIEDAEYEEDDENDIADEAMFQIENCGDRINDDDNELKMNHPIAETLDICMKKMFDFSMKFNYVQTKIEDKEISSTTSTNNTNNNKHTKIVNLMNYFKVILNVFDNLILPSHNTHHVQFILFYYCSFKTFLVDKFLTYLWNKATNLNVSAPIRQAAVGYIASFLARAKFISITIVKNYLYEMCNWAHHYIESSDSVRTNNSLKANSVFFSVCQAVFYVIAFRSRDLTSDKKSLMFLQSLQLSALVTCNFNPLRVCLPAVATTFAGVTRAYQLAYCHTILERNARRKLPTMYANNTLVPEEYLATFFPFDPYLLKKSGEYITPNYLQYQASEAEEEESNSMEKIPEQHRKRGDSEMIGDDVDDFINDKRFKYSELSKSNDKEIQFTYGLSPGYH